MNWLRKEMTLTVSFQVCVLFFHEKVLVNRKKYSHNFSIVINGRKMFPPAWPIWQKANWATQVVIRFKWLFVCNNFLLLRMRQMLIWRKKVKLFNIFFQRTHIMADQKLNIYHTVCVLIVSTSVPFSIPDLTLLSLNTKTDLDITHEQV